MITIPKDVAYTYGRFPTYGTFVVRATIARYLGRRWYVGTGIMYDNHLAKPVTSWRRDIRGDHLDSHPEDNGVFPVDWVD